MLTKRQLEVLCLVREGLTSKMIAERLFVSKRTVDFHLHTIYERLGASNRMQAVYLATRKGLLPIEPPVTL